MLVIPAIDLSEGKVVRLQRGDLTRKTVYSDDAAEMARRWEQAGAALIHLVDLDAAISGESHNWHYIGIVCSAVDIPIQLGGGLRDQQRVAEAFAAGVARVVIGTAAVEDRAEFKRLLNHFRERIAVGIDARGGQVAVRGWTKGTDIPAVEFALAMEAVGVQRLIYTDIATDGMLSGPNIQGVRAVCEAVGIPVIASGGVASLDDIRKLKELESLGLEGVITGRALYEGTLDLAEAIRAAK